MSKGQINDVNKGNCQCCENHVCPNEKEIMKETHSSNLKVVADEYKVKLDEKTSACSKDDKAITTKETLKHSERDDTYSVHTRKSRSTKRRENYFEMLNAKYNKIHKPMNSNICALEGMKKYILRTSKSEGNFDDEIRIVSVETMKQIKTKPKVSSPGNQETNSNSYDNNENHRSGTSISNVDTSHIIDGENVYTEAGKNEELAEDDSHKNVNNVDGHTYTPADDGEGNNQSHSTFREFWIETTRVIAMLREGESVTYEYLEFVSARSIDFIEALTHKISSFVITYSMYAMQYVTMSFIFVLANIFWVLIWFSALLFMVLLTYPFTVISTLFDLLVNNVIYPSIPIVICVIAMLLFILIVVILCICLSEYLEKRRNTRTYRHYKSLDLIMSAFPKRTKCFICYEIRQVVCLAPCGHSGICNICVSRIKLEGNGLCPLCRSVIYRFS